MTLPCVCELTAGGQKPPATAPATVRVDQQRRTQDRASSELPTGAPGPLRSQRRRSGQDGHPARCTGQLRPLAQTKTSQQIEHTRTSRFFPPASPPAEEVRGPSTARRPHAPNRFSYTTARAALRSG